MSAFGDFISKNSASVGGVVGSAVNGLFSLIGQRRQFKFQKQLNEQQQQMALDQMQQSQDYNLANMATQNQYAIDAEKRAQEWNDIGAQASRARAAGISPLAALGASSGGVLSQSSAPSSSTPSPAGTSAGSVGGVGSLGLDLIRARAVDADAALKKSQTIAQDIQNEINDATKASQQNIIQLREKGMDISNQQNEFNYFVSQVSAPIGIQQQQQNLMLAYAQTFKIYADVSREKSLADSQVDLNNSEILLNAARSGLVSAQTANVQEDTKLKGLQMMLTANQAEYSRLLSVLTEKDIISKDISNDLDKFRSEFEKSHKEKEWKRERSNETIRTIGTTVSGVIGAAASLVGALSPAGAVGSSIGTVITTVENYNAKGKLKGYTKTATQQENTKFAK